MEKGWIKLHRSIMQHPLYCDDRFSRGQAWIDLLMLANHAPKTIWIKGKPIKIDRGQLAWSMVSLAERWKWDWKTVKAFFLHMSSEGMLESVGTSQTTITTILNYGQYQDNGEQIPEQSPEQAPEHTPEHSPYKQEVKKIRSKEKRGADRPLSPEECVDYFKANNSTNLEAEKFYDYFEANGWKQGGRTAMKNWRAAARNWIRRAETFKPKAQTQTYYDERWYQTQVAQHGREVNQRIEMYLIQEATNMSKAVIGYKYVDGNRLPYPRRMIGESVWQRSGESHVSTASPLR